MTDLVGFDGEMEERRGCIGVLREMRERDEEEMRVLEGFWVYMG